MSSAESRRPSYRPFAVEVVRVEDLSPTFRRLTLAGPDLHECGGALLDQRVKLVCGEPAAELVAPQWLTSWRALPEARRPAMRTYTLSAVDPAAGRVSIDLACRPAHGPASRFAQEATPGTRLVLVAPDARSRGSQVDGIAWRPGPARDVLLVGDETALPAVRNILAALPAGTSGQVVLDLPHPDDAVELGIHPGVRLDIVSRDPAGVGVAADDLLAAWFARALPAPPGASTPAADGSAEELLWEEAGPGAGTGGTYGWLAGEAGWMASLRRRDRAHPVPERSCGFMGYWRRGQSSQG